MAQQIRTLHISTGIHWVEIPELDLCILCGCPADAIKHLRKRGLIEQVSKDGVSFETGPNAILLSDVLRQNGSFSNLTEFPVLQMLYLQGMILPNHPNNTGRKPRLIGSPAQLKAQLAYIYRGNYGLTSTEEIIQTGIPAEEAEQMMRIKLHFAFGKITRPEELLDLSPIEETQEILLHPEGLYLRRQSLNVYTFLYKGESVTVDLNLKAGQTYTPSYQLSYHNIARDYFSIIHSGEGDGWDIHRPCMASIIVFQGKLYLIDAGPNILSSLRYLGISVNEIEGIFHTHAHDDHFAGLTTLIRTDRRLKYFATPLVRASVTKKLCALMNIEEQRFEDFFHIHDLAFDQWNNVDGLDVMPLYSPHPVETNIFFFRARWGDAYQTYAHLADVVSERVFRGMIADERDKRGITPERFREIMEGYLRYANLKKVDIGGGLIHGDAEDYIHDTSEKLLLAHTSEALPPKQREIGSVAAFGMVDVLIPAKHNYLIDYARKHLRFYFPDAPDHEINYLLNHPIRSVNAGTLLLKEQQRLEEVFLLLTGSVEFIEKSTGNLSTFPAGSLIGFYSGYLGLATQHAYWAASHLNILCLPAKAYHDFVRRNGLYDQLRQLEENILFLEKTWLFGEVVSFPILARIAQQMDYQQLPAGTALAFSAQTDLYVLVRGAATLHINDSKSETLEAGDFFSLERFFAHPHSFRVVMTSDVLLCTIPSALLIEIPIVYWKLLETHERRVQHLH